jgi:UDP-N-acetylmuramate--alanine ligase
VLWQEDADYLGVTSPNGALLIQDSSTPEIDDLQLLGRYNRLDAWLAIQAVHTLTNAPVDQLVSHINAFPGLQRRMEQIIPNLYTDYAHTPDKVRGAMSVALEIASKHNQPLVVVYEPLTNRRQHFMKDDYGDCFAGATKVYWTPSYLAREDPTLRIIPPEELITHLSDPLIAEPAKLDAQLKKTIQKHLADGAMVVGMAGGGGGSLDEWLRGEFQKA